MKKVVILCNSEIQEIWKLGEDICEFFEKHRFNACLLCSANSSKECIENADIIFIGLEPLLNIEEATLVPLNDHQKLGLFTIRKFMSERSIGKWRAQFPDKNKDQIIELYTNTPSLRLNEIKTLLDFVA